MEQHAAGRVAVVTGAGTGIGKAVALGLVADGWSVVLIGRRIDRLEATARESGAPADRVLVAATDVTDADAVRAAFDAAQAKFTRLDLLFNNAGVNVPGVPLEDLAVDEWRYVVDVNLTGAFLCTQRAVAWMKRQQPRGGRIINNGSISAHAPRPHSAPYTATKHAITGLTKATGLDGRAFGIACGQIDIGNAATDMAHKMTQGVPQANGSVAVEPVMDLRHVVDAVRYMANLPLDANVPFLTVMATEMPYLGRG